MYSVEDRKRVEPRRVLIPPLGWCVLPPCGRDTDAMLSYCERSGKESL